MFGLPSHRSFEEVSGRPRRSSKKVGCPRGDHTLRARRTGMKPCLETLDEAKVRQSLEHKGDEVTREVTIEREKNFQNTCGQRGR